MVHVAVDAHNLVRDDRGIGRYARAVLRRALHAPDFRWTLVVRGWLTHRRTMATALGVDDVRVARSVPRDTDVLWFPWNGTFLPLRAPSVATMHDVVPFTEPAPSARIRKSEQTPFLRTAATARRILVQSEFTAREVQRALGVPRERIVVTPLAADPVFTPGAPSKLPTALRGRRYLLHVGAHDRRKNTATLGAAFASAFRDRDVLLAFTRQPQHLPPNAIVVDVPDDVALRDLYRGAVLVCVPSTSEGFGLPLLEALACAAPAIASRAGALPEVGGAAAAWIDEPQDVGTWARTLRALVDDDDERQRLATLGPARAATFSWERCAAQTLRVLAEVASEGTRSPCAS